MGAHWSDSRTVYHLVGFTVGKEEFCVDILKVQEIIRMMEITKIPNAPDYAEGVINLRGKVIPVINFRKRFNLSQDDDLSMESRRIIVVDAAETTLGLVVDQVSQVVKIDGERVLPTPETVKSGAGDCFYGVGRLDERLVILLDVENIFHHGELAWADAE